MSMLLALWLPILVSGIVLFVASFLAWMVLPHHRPDWSQLPDEDAVIATLKQQAVSPGQYMYPYCGPEQMKSEEFQRKLKAGPSGVLTVFPAATNMGVNLALTFLFFLFASFCIGYVGSIALPRGTEFMKAFRLVGTTGILTFCFSGIPNAIWFKRKVRTDLLDGIAYGLLCGLVFAILWPAA